MKKKYNVIDLFAGCGGLLEGFLHADSYFPIASVEWLDIGEYTYDNSMVKKG